MKNKLFEFIDSSPSAFHTVDNIVSELILAGFVRVNEGDKFSVKSGDKFFAVRNGSSLIAVDYKGKGAPFMIGAAHSDSPSFKVKEEKDGVYTALATEKYGGMIMYSWFDRPLSIAGRVAVRAAEGIEMRLINIDRDLLVIPSVAIHYNPKVNDGFSPSPARDTFPLLSIESGVTLASVIAAELEIDENDIISHDLYLYVRERAKTVGINSELILSPRLDDLECVYTALTAFLSKEDGEGEASRVLAVFDNEEVGSETKQGAASTFLYDVLERISGDREDYLAALSRSFMVSADNAHAKHPAHPEISDPQNAPTLGAGIVIKHNANQKYTTDAISDAVFSEICRKSGVAVQHYYNRADIAGGSTLGSIANTKVSVMSVDIGLAQLAMHSAVETAALSDTADMVRALSRFFASSLAFDGSKIVIK